MTSDNLLRFWPWALCATEARRHAENCGGLQKYPRVRLATLDIIPAHNALKHGEKLLLLRAAVTSSPALFIAHTTSSSLGRDGTPPEAGPSACSCNGKTSSTRMSIPKCSSVIRAEFGGQRSGGGGGAACGPRGGRRVPRLRTREGRRTRFCSCFAKRRFADHRYSMHPFPGNAASGVVFDHQGSAVGRRGRQRAGPLSDRRRGPCRRPPQHVTLERRPSEGQWAMRVVAARAVAVPLSGDAGMRCGWEVRESIGLAWPIVPHRPPAPPAPPANRRQHLPPAPPAGAAAGWASRLCTRRHDRPPLSLPAGAHVATARYSVHRQSTKQHGLHGSIDHV
jgi:hypothetical protein